MGNKSDGFNLLHCNFRKAISAIFSLLHCKLREIKLVYFDPLRNLRKTRSAIFSLLHCNLSYAKLVSSICFATISGRRDLLSLVCSAANSGMLDCYLRSTSLQLQEC
ncbi:hypothetical protein J1N35_037843 [Gossypium stocksii]|uniref:Uncharacterized protein n=1 Tax=Gossypium stocksii TaxID=47602 RepID=A0A9D3ZM22_9ROSI|nr:hypothetical protein J1N35_037843 [Gossypium stocksii]